MKLADISLLNSCNLACDYCKSGSSPVRQNNTAGAWDVSSPVLDFAPLVSFIRTHLPDYILQLTGGEPLTIAGIEYLANDLSNTHTIIINTNGTLLPNKYNRLDPRIKLRISLHPEQRPLETFSKYLDGITPDRVLINYVLHPRHIKNDKYITYLQWLDSCGFPYEVTPFEGMYLGKGYRLYHEIYNGIRTPPVTMIKEFQIVVIQPNGKVYPCHGELDHDKPIGDVYTGEFDSLSVCNNRCRMPNFDSLCPMFDPVIRILG